MSRELSERKLLGESLQKLQELGIDPYPAELFEVNVTAKGIKTMKRASLIIRT